MELVTRALVSVWVFRFGLLSRITTDCQFERVCFPDCSEFSSFTPQVSYHLTGMVERFHRQLKTAICAAPDLHCWSEFTPIVLMGFCSAAKEDLGYSSAELLYGTTLALPGQRLGTR